MADPIQSEIEKIRAQVPDGLATLVWTLLIVHVGREHAISRGKLVAAVIRSGYHVDDRDVRLGIELCRLQGYPIMSAGGRGGGYWKARDYQDFDDFMHEQVTGRISTLSMQKKALTGRCHEFLGKRPAPEGQLVFSGLENGLTDGNGPERSE